VTLIDRNEGDDIAHICFHGCGLEHHGLPVCAFVQHLDLDFRGGGRKGEEAGNGGGCKKAKNVTLHCAYS